jgi:hypothetical protein
LRAGELEFEGKAAPEPERTAAPQLEDEEKKEPAPPESDAIVIAESVEDPKDDQLDTETEAE